MNDRWAVRYGIYRVARTQTRSKRNRNVAMPSGRAVPVVSGILSTAVWLPLVWIAWGNTLVFFPLVAIGFTWLLVLTTWRKT